MEASEGSMILSQRSYNTKHKERNLFQLVYLAYKYRSQGY